MDNNWSTEVPTEPGKYWAYEALDPRDADVMLVELKGKDHNIFWSINHGLSFPPHHFSHFQPFDKENPLPPLPPDSQLSEEVP